VNYRLTMADLDIEVSDVSASEDVPKY